MYIYNIYVYIYIIYMYIYIIYMYIYNMYIVKLGLITPAILINPLSAPKKCNLHTGGPPGFINRLARTLLINPLC